MKAGDLVKPIYPDLIGIRGAHLVVMSRTNWVKILGCGMWIRWADLELINANR
jgi:hypothetical protein